MEKKGKISQYRERMDKTLASPDLKNEESLKTLVKNQLLHSSQDENEGCSENVLQKRTTEVSSFLDMLRSASVNDIEKSHTEWKLKQDTEEFRVMYREGPQGTKFHSLLVEGYVDGPVDVCLCVSWESTLYKKWWPQSSFPSFKILSCKCLQKVRVCEQISLVRVKVAWPLSAREALVHYFVFEYFQDDLIVVILNTLSDVESIDRNTHGFTNDGIPEEKDVVRIGLVGGFALQKVTPERSYFRTIANMDIKLDFVPPSLINFISRQLIGNGFRLYQKAVASVFHCDEDFNKALKDPLYAQICGALYSINEPNGALEQQELKSEACILPEEHIGKNMQDDLRSEACSLPEEHIGKNMQDDLRNVDQEVHINNQANEPSPKKARVMDKKVFGEIEEEDDGEEEEEEEEEEEAEGRRQSEEGNKVAETYNINGNKKISISSDVEQALGILEKVISMVREYGFNAQIRSSFRFTKENSPNLEESTTKDSTSLEDGGTCLNDAICVEESRKETMERASVEPRNSSGIHDLRRAGSNSHSRDVSHNRIAPASPEDNILVPIESDPVALCSSKSETTEAPLVEKTMRDDKQMNAKVNGIHENTLTEGKKLSRQLKHRFCCFHFNSGLLVA